MNYFIVLISLFIVWITFYELYGIISSQIKKKQKQFGEKLASYRRSYWHALNPLLLMAVVLLNCRNALDSVHHAQIALKTYNLHNFPIDMTDSYRTNAVADPSIIALTILFISFSFIEFIFTLTKGEIYEKGILEGTSFYPFNGMEQILEKDQIRLVLKKRKLLFKRIRLTPHDKEKEHIRKILCDKVAYEQIFY